MRIVPVVGVLVGLSFFAACRGGSNNNKPDPDAPGSGSDGGGSAALKVKDVQTDAVAPGAEVELRGVVVVAVDGYGNNKTDRRMWIQDAGGGPQSGVLVFRPPASVTSLVPGDIVDVVGAIKTEFAFNGDTPGQSLTELQNPTGRTMTVTKTGTGAAIAPMVVDALTIGRKATEALRDADWEPWEGVLITLNNVTAFGAPGCITSQGNCTDPTRTNLTITGTAKLESNLAAFPTLAAGDCLASVTGILDYAFDYALLPRSTDDVKTGGTGCVPREGIAACSDDMDNDGNGFKDCGDFSCAAGPTAWLGATCAATDAMCGCSMNLTAGMSVNKVNTGTTGAAILNEVFVTAVGARGFWVADALQAAASGGTFVFTNAVPDAAITVGTKLATVQGLAGPFGSKTEKLIQITTPTTGAGIPGGDPLAITTATTMQVKDLTTGRPFMGSLVTLTNLKVTAVNATTLQVTLTDNNNVTVIMDDGAFAMYGGTPPAVGACFPALTGVMDLLIDDQIRTINPRKVEDMATGSGCN
jgi:hypothetical protein